MLFVKENKIRCYSFTQSPIDKLRYKRNWKASRSLKFTSRKLETNLKETPFHSCSLFPYPFPFLPPPRQNASCIGCLTFSYSGIWNCTWLEFLYRSKTSVCIFALRRKYNLTRRTQPTRSTFFVSVKFHRLTPELTPSHSQHPSAASSLSKTSIQCSMFE